MRSSPHHSPPVNTDNLTPNTGVANLNPLDSMASPIKNLRSPHLPSTSNRSSELLRLPQPTSQGSRHPCPLTLQFKGACSDIAARINSRKARLLVYI